MMRWKNVRVWPSWSIAVAYAPVVKDNDSIVRLSTEMVHLVKPARRGGVQPAQTSLFYVGFLSEVQT